MNFAVVSRSGGGDAVKAAAYNLCGRLQHRGARFDFRHKAREHVGGAVLLPAGAPDALRDPGALWRAAEAVEKRHDAQTARQVLLSIPREVPPELRLAWVQAVAQPWVDDGAAVQVDLHCPRTADGDEQPHAHLLLSLRRVTDQGLAPTKAREWNQQWREDGGRAERRRIEERANAWLAAHGVAARLDLRSLADRGEDRPPEPTAPRADWQRWLREGADPGAAPVTVAAALQHRAQRAALVHADADVAHAAAEAAALARELAGVPEEPRRAPSQVFQHGPGRPRASTPPPGATAAPSRPVPPPQPPQEVSVPPAAPAPARPPARRRPTPARRPSPRPQQQAEPWTRRRGGLEALSEQHQAAARRSYERWTQGRPELARRHDLADYVQYVQSRHADRPGADEEAPATPTEASIAPASGEVRDARRRAHLSDLLAQRYRTPDALADLVQRVTLDHEGRAADLYLAGGVRLRDHGDRLEHVGQLTSAAAEAIAAAAAAHGWERVTLTGGEAYLEAVSVACALREPPLQTDHALSREGRERVAERLRARALAAVAPLDAAAVRGAASPAAAAELVLGHAEARARAALAGRPTGSTDPDELARPRLAELAQRRDTARADAAEAADAAARHRQAHPWTARLLDGAVRRRQAALDTEARRLDREADRLDRRHDRDVRTVTTAARAEARANRTALDDWMWSRPVRGAEQQLDRVARVRAAVAAGDERTLAAAARGDLEQNPNDRSRGGFSWGWKSDSPCWLGTEASLHGENPIRRFALPADCSGRGWPVPARCGRPLRGCGGDGDPLGAGLACHRRHPSQG